MDLFKLLYGLSEVYDVPVMVWGDPGLGKTRTIQRVGDVTGRLTITKSGNKSDATDFSGLPYKDTDENGEVITKYSMPRYAQQLVSAGNGILFYDELTTCPPHIQAAMLSIIQDADFGEFKIPRETFRVAAGNYSNIVGTHHLSLALMNRFVHLFVEPDVESFTNGFVTGWSNYNIPKINSMEERDSKYLMYSQLVVGFMKAQPDKYYTFREDIIEKTDVAYATPRSWDMLCHVLSVLDQNEDDYVKTLITGSVGMESGKAFYHYMKDNIGKNIDLTVYLGREDEFRLPHPDDMDEVIRIMDAAVYWVNKDPAKYIKLWESVNEKIYNKDKKFGDYQPYDMIIMKYLQNTMRMLQNYSKGANRINKFISRSEFPTVGVEGRYYIDTTNDTYYKWNRANKSFEVTDEKVNVTGEVIFDIMQFSKKWKGNFYDLYVAQCM